MKDGNCGKCEKLKHMESVNDRSVENGKYGKCEQWKCGKFE